MRSEDGRGPLWWANEAGNQEIIDLLRAKGVRNDLKVGLYGGVAYGTVVCTVMCLILWGRSCGRAYR